MKRGSGRPGSGRRLAWFAALWLAGAGAMFVLVWAIRLALGT